MSDLITDLSDIFGFFGDLFSALPAVIVLLGTFFFGSVIFIGLLHLFRR